MACPPFPPPPPRNRTENTGWQRKRRPAPSEPDYIKDVGCGGSPTFLMFLIVVVLIVLGRL